MLTCKQVSRTLARQDYDTLSRFQRTGLKIHVALCAVCGGYNRQVMIMQDAARHYKRREDDLTASPELGSLSDEDKQTIKSALHEKNL